MFLNPLVTWSFSLLILVMHSFFKFLFYFSILGCVSSFSSCGARASRGGGFSCCEAWAVGHWGFSSCGSWAELPHDMWNLPRPGIEPMSPALAGGFLTTGPPGKPLVVHPYWGRLPAIHHAECKRIFVWILWRKIPVFKGLFSKQDILFLGCIPLGHYPSCTS